MLKFFRWPIRIIATLLVVVVLYINVALYDAPTCDPVPNGFIHVDVMKQLNFLQRMLREENAGTEMQLLYPEGYVFIYAMYAMAWCDVVDKLPVASTSRQEGMREIAFSMIAMDAPAGRRVFNPDLPLTYGAFYRGWTAYVRGRYLEINEATDRDTAVFRQFRRHFLVYRLGLPGIREYPRGKTGLGDIDSGPVVLGIGGAASIIGIKAATRYGDWALATALRSGVSSLLFPQSDEQEKCYLLGRLPILDAFMARSNTEICKAEGSIRNWRWKFQLISLLFVSGIILLLRRV